MRIRCFGLNQSNQEREREKEKGRMEMRRNAAVGSDNRDGREGWRGRGGMGPAAAERRSIRIGRQIRMRRQTLTNKRLFGEKYCSLFLSVLHIHSSLLLFLRSFDRSSGVS